MKNTYRRFGALFLTLIYCFAIGFIAKSFIVYGNQSKPITKAEKYFSSISTNYSFSYAPKSTNSVDSITIFSVVTLKTLLYQQWIISRATEQLLETVFFQYTRFSINFLIHYRKKDTIFPFHYFW